MLYDEARPHIATGDLVAVRRRTGPLAVGTRLVTGSPYTHTGVALGVGPRLLIAQLNAGGAGFAPLSQMAEFAFDVFACPVDRVAVEDVIWDLFGERMGYDFADLVRIALHIRLGFPLPPDSDGRVCSSLTAVIYLAAGWNAPALPSIPWPGAIVDAFNAPPSLEIRQ